jgi:putative membrane protein
MKVIRAIKYLFLIAVAIALVVLAMANRDPVTLTLLPQELALWSGVDLTIDLPLFVVILGGVATGVLWGFVWEWLREHRHRAAAKTNHREAKKLGARGRGAARQGERGPRRDPGACRGRRSGALTGSPHVHCHEILRVDPRAGRVGGRRGRRAHTWVWFSSRNRRGTCRWRPRANWPCWRPRAWPRSR